MPIGSKFQLKSLNVDDFILSYDDTPLELVENAKYLGQSTYYRISLLRRLRHIFSMNHILQVYKSYIQPRLDYSIPLCGCSTQKDIDLVQRVQNHAARLIMGNFAYINCRGIDLVKSLNLYTIRERRDYFLTTLMFKAIHGIGIWDRIDMHFDIHGYDTRNLQRRCPTSDIRLQCCRQGHQPVYLSYADLLVRRFMILAVSEMYNDSAMSQETLNVDGRLLSQH